MVFRLIKSFFRSVSINKVFRHCLEADENLMVNVMVFYKSYKAVGIELSPDTSSFDQLEKILKKSTPENKELIVQGVAAFFGCIIREQLGGRWGKTSNGRYQISGIKNSDITIDWENDLVLPLLNEPPVRLGELYEKITVMPLEG